MSSNCHEHDHTEIPKYWHALDKETFTNNNFSSKDLAISTPPFKNQLDSIRARIMQGANNIELGFIGTGKGGAQNLTPDTIGKPEREAIKQIAKINDVGVISVHTSMSVQGLAGFQQGEFSEAKREQDMHEVKRTVDFASDVTEGGAIVVHTGEYPYSIARKYGDKPFITKDGKKIALSEATAYAEKAPRYLVDKYDGKVSGAIQKDFEVPVMWKDEENNVFGTKLMKLDYFEEQAKENMRDDKRKEENRKSFTYYTEKDLKDNEYKNTYGDAVWLANLQKSRISMVEENARLRSHNLNIEKGKEQNKIIKNQIELDENMLKSKELESEELLAIKERLLKSNESLEHLEKTQEIESDHAIAYDLRIKNQMKPAYEAISIEQFGENKTSESVAELALHAAKMTEKQNLKKPLFIAPENLWDGQYGSHPQDLKKIILSGREKMVEILTNDKLTINGVLTDNPHKSKIKEIYGKNKLSENEAKRIAKDHIKATFDIGHANIWKKYFGGTDKEFNQWLGKEVSELTKEGIIGHAHVSDNFGYNDEHLPPGYGNAPIKEFMTHLKKSGYKGEIVIEPGHHDIGAMREGVKHLETPIYRINNQTSTWTDISGSYFGQSYIPSFVTPAYLPLGGGGKSTQPFTWTELPLE